jgi:NifB/MoaA-like Fe-S oxidoreductase
VPNADEEIFNPKSKIQNPKSLFGTILTGEMFAPVLREQIEKLNAVVGSELEVVAVPNTYFGGDVSVAGLLTGQDFLAVRDRIRGDFVVIPKHVIKSDEPILLDGMQFNDLKAQFPVPVIALDVQDLMKMFLER